MLPAGRGGAPPRETGKLSEEHRARAIDRIEALRRLLVAQPQADAAPLAEECEHLLRAVRASHMEAIRFRVYGITRGLSRLDPAAPREAAALLDEARAAIEAAGFRTG